LHLINNKLIACLVFSVFSASIVTACAPAASIDGSNMLVSSPTTRQEPSPSQLPPHPTEIIPETTEIITTATETSKPPTSTLPVANPPTHGFTVCDEKPDDLPPPATPSPQAGIPVELDSTFPPAPPAKVEGISSESSVLLTWGGTGTDVDQFYKAYRRMEGDECWQLIGTILAEGDNKGGYQFESIGIVQAENYIYTITTIDIYGNESNLLIAEILNSES
jgi:hypothetical protein